MFCKYVQDQFDFLIKEYTFTKYNCNNNMAIYKSQEVMIKLVYDNQRSFEINCYISLISSNNEYDIGSILNYKDINEEYYINHICQASTNESLKYCIKLYATLLSKYFDNFLKGDRSEFSLLENFCQTKYENLAKEKEVKNIKKEITIAWNIQDYSRVARLSFKIIDNLTLAEHKKMEYAKKQ